MKLPAITPASGRKLPALLRSDKAPVAPVSDGTGVPTDAAGTRLPSPEEAAALREAQKESLAHAKK